MEKVVTPLEIVLTNPVKFGEETIAKLEFRRPRGRDFRELKGMDSPVGAMLDMAACLAGVSAKVIDELCVEDTIAVLEVMGSFFPSSLQTGRK